MDDFEEGELPKKKRGEKKEKKIISPKEKKPRITY